MLHSPAQLDSQFIAGNRGPPGDDCAFFRDNDRFAIANHRACCPDRWYVAVVLQPRIFFPLPAFLVRDTSPDWSRFLLKPPSQKSRHPWKKGGERIVSRRRSPHRNPLPLRPDAIRRPPRQRRLLQCRGPQMPHGPVRLPQPGTQPPQLHRLLQCRGLPRIPHQPSALHLLQCRRRRRPRIPHQPSALRLLQCRRRSRVSQQPMPHLRLLQHRPPLLQQRTFNTNLP